MVMINYSVSFYGLSSFELNKYVELSTLRIVRKSNRSKGPFARVYNVSKWTIGPSVDVLVKKFLKRML